MKKYFLFFFCFLSLTSTVFFSSSYIFIDTFPSIHLDNRTVESNNFTNEDLRYYNNLNDFISFGINFKRDNHNIIFRLNLKKDLGNYYKFDNFTNFLLYINDGKLKINFDANYPDLGYYEYNDQETLISIGRRKLKKGPGTYDFILSDQSTYFDHIYLSSVFEGNSFNYEYNYFMISSERESSGGYKTYVNHEFSIIKENSFKFSFGEQNLIYGRLPDLLDITPFTSFHNIYASGSNVMMSVSLDVLLFDGNFRTYGQMVMDDFRLNSESPNSNPNAFGWFKGIEILLIKEESFFDSEKFRKQDYTLIQENFSFKSGLRLRYENYFASTFLYNRNEKIGKFINPIKTNTFYMGRPVIDTYYGFPYGPDSKLDLIELIYSNNNLKSKFRFEYLKKGSFGIEGEYNRDVWKDMDWKGPQDPITKYYILSTENHYLLDESNILNFICSISFSEIYERPKIYFTFGYGSKFKF